MADVFEQLTYVVRLFVIAFVCGTLAVLILLVTPTIDERPTHAQLLASRIVYDGGFGPQPGVVDEEQFLGLDDTSHIISFEQSQLYPIGARARILDTHTSDPLLDHEVFYNRGAYDILSGQRIVFSGHETKQWTFPVALLRTNGEREAALLEVEVVYATR